jgi:hypothetical protein
MVDRTGILSLSLRGIPQYPLPDAPTCQYSSLTPL